MDSGGRSPSTDVQNDDRDVHDRGDIEGARVLLCALRGSARGWIRSDYDALTASAPKDADGSLFTVPQAEELIWYDGALRPRRDAVERIEVDALSLLADAVAEFEKDDSGWLLLLDGLDIPTNVDEPDEGTFSRGYSVSVIAEHVVLGLSHRLPRQLEATLAEVTRQPWCFGPQLRSAAIEMRVHNLDETMRLRIEKGIASQADSVRERMRRTVGSLASTAEPSLLPRATATLENALQTVDALASAKTQRVMASCGPA